MWGESGGGELVAGEGSGEGAVGLVEERVTVVDFEEAETGESGEGAFDDLLIFFGF